MTKVGIIGGGFYGLYLALHLKNKGYKVTVIEREDAPMSKASYNNQARVHNGYHYPRSVLTALRSRISFPRFVEEFSECIFSDFSHYYALGRTMSKVSADQFTTFSKHIGASLEQADKSIFSLFNKKYVDGIFKVKEYAFDAVKLRDHLMGKVAASDILFMTQMLAKRVRPQKQKLLLDCEDRNGQRETFEYDQVLNCTYSNINQLVRESGLEIIPLKHELTEMCLVSPPAELDGIAITMMCGPFFSIMPFPAENLYSLSHVRYTPHSYFVENQSAENHSSIFSSTRTSNFQHMIYDARRYVPALADVRYHRSLWELKTILPSTEDDDARPILASLNYGLQGFHCIMGGKIDNVYDVAQQLDYIL